MTKRKNQNTYSHGGWNAICPICGWKWKASDLVKRWDGQMVCPRDIDPYHPQDLVRAVEDKQAVPWTRPEQEDEFVTVSHVTKDDWDDYPHNLS